jgi:hypothetical protein
MQKFINFFIDYFPHIGKFEYSIGFEKIYHIEYSYLMGRIDPDFWKPNLDL